MLVDIRFYLLFEEFINWKKGLVRRCILVIRILSVGSIGLVGIFREVLGEFFTVIKIIFMFI